MTISSLPSSRKTVTDVAENFTATFDLPESDDNPIRLSVDDFDKWARRCGYYDDFDFENHDALVASRQRVRGALNNVSLGQPWRDIGGSPFAVSVFRAGEEYLITSAAKGYIESGVNLPKRVQGIADTRYNQLETLRDAVDYENLPLKIQVEIDQQLTNVENWKARLELETGQLEKGFRRLRNVIRDQSESAAVLIANHDDDDDGGVAA